jgi:hypothetical protein
MRITRLELQTNDLKEQALFYGETLGLDTRIIAGTQVLVRAGATDLVFIEAEDDLHCQYHFAFNIPENQIETAKQWLAIRAKLLVNEDGETTIYSKTWDSHSLYFKDPAGNILELIARHGLQNASEQFEILSISEIGLATEDVMALVEDLKRKTGMVLYKNEDSDTFTAVGDSEGLFIVVKQGRIWYPNTGVPAQFLPIRVYLKMDNLPWILSGVPYEIDAVFLTKR